MSDTTIQTIKTMLAHLDDAKKYQSLRDVLQTLPAPDVAAVFEDLPPEFSSTAARMPFCT